MTTIQVFAGAYAMLMKVSGKMRRAKADNVADGADRVESPDLIIRFLGDGVNTDASRFGSYFTAPRRRGRLVA